jgi:hypothetical protein
MFASTRLAIAFAAVYLVASTGAVFAYNLPDWCAHPVRAKIQGTVVQELCQ